MLALFTLLLEVVLPVFAVVAVGAAVGRRFDLQVTPINRLAIYAAVPALAFRTMAGIEMAWGPALHLVGGYLAFMLAMGALAALFGRRWRPSRRRTLIGTSIFGNAANLNLPVALFAFGDPGLERALVLYVVTALSLFGLGPLLLGRATGVRRALRTALGFPVLWATVAGLALNATGIALPVGATRGIGLLADAAVPVVLLSLGIHLARSAHWRPERRTWLAVGLKLGVGPVVAAAVGAALGLTGLDLAVLVVLGGMPTAINAAMLAVEFGGEAEQVGEAVVVGTALALVTLPLVLAFALTLSRGGTMRKIIGSLLAFVALSEVIVYSPFSDEFMQALARPFTQETGIRVLNIVISTGESQSRLRAEAARPQADFWLSVRPAILAQAFEEGLIEAYTPAGADRCCPRTSTTSRS
jgi:malate permease and related proteins